MFIFNLIVAFIIAVLLWYFGSWALAQFVFRIETRNPRIMGRAPWSAVEFVLTLAVFVLCVAAWVGLTYLLERINP